jgi:hypothetical protein
VAVYYRIHQEQWTADGHFASSQTLRALHRSLLRRRHHSMALPDWRS